MYTLLPFWSSLGSLALCRNCTATDRNSSMTAALPLDSLWSYLTWWSPWWSARGASAARRGAPRPGTGSAPCAAISRGCPCAGTARRRARTAPWPARCRSSPCQTAAGMRPACCDMNFNLLRPPTVRVWHFQTNVITNLQFEHNCFSYLNFSNLNCQNPVGLSKETKLTLVIHLFFHMLQISYAWKTWPFLGSQVKLEYIFHSNKKCQSEKSKLKDCISYKDKFSPVLYKQ